MLSRRITAALAQFLEFGCEQVGHPQASRKCLGDVPVLRAPRIHVHLLQQKERSAMALENPGYI
jgi:hypothetical protein